MRKHTPLPFRAETATATVARGCVLHAVCWFQSLRYLLKENGLSWTGDKPDVNMDFTIPTAQLAAQLISGKIQYAVVPEPFATIASVKSSKVIAA